MKHVLIAQELNVSNFEDHMKTEAVASILQHLSSLLLLFTKGWDDTLVGESRERLDIVWVPLGVNAAILTSLEVEDRGLDVWFLTMGHFTLAVKVPDGLGEEFGNVWTLLLESVPDVVGGDDIGLTTLKCTSNTEKSNNVRVICVEELSAI